MPGKRSGSGGAGSAQVSSGQTADKVPGSPVKGDNPTETRTDNPSGGSDETEAAGVSGEKSADMDVQIAEVTVPQEMPASSEAPPRRRRGRPPKMASAQSSAQTARGKTGAQAKSSEDLSKSSDGTTPSSTRGQRGAKRKLGDEDTTSPVCSVKGGNSGEPSAKRTPGEEELSALTSPRRSGRGLKPNRKYADMEVEIVKKRTPRASAGASHSEGQKKTGPRTAKTLSESKQLLAPTTKSDTRMKDPASTKTVTANKDDSAVLVPEPMELGTAVLTEATVTVATTTTTSTTNPSAAALSSESVLEQKEVIAKKVGGGVPTSKPQIQIVISPTPSIPASLAPPASVSLASHSKHPSASVDAYSDDLSDLGSIAADAGIQVMDADTLAGVPAVGGALSVRQIEVPVGQGGQVSLLPPGGPLSVTEARLEGAAHRTAEAGTSVDVESSSQSTEGDVLMASSQSGEQRQIMYETVLKQLKADSSAKSNFSSQLTSLKNFPGKVIVVHPPKGAIITNRGSKAAPGGSFGTTSSRVGATSDRTVASMTAATGSQPRATCAPSVSTVSFASTATATVTSAMASELTFSGADMSEVCPPMSPALVTPVSLTSTPELEASSQLTSLEVVTPGTSKLTLTSSPKKIVVSEAVENSLEKESQLSAPKVLGLEEMDEDLANAVLVLSQREKDEGSESSNEEASNSKYSTASTQTPIEQAAKEGTVLSSGSVMKTVSVSMPGEPGHSGGQGRQEIILVTLPEGTSVKQAVVRRRELIDHNDPNFQAVEIDGFYHCNACPYNTSKKANWYKHKRKHMGLRPHQCPHCSYSAATSSNLRRHVAIHEDVRTHQCHICNLMFRQKIHLERHIKYKHEEKSVQCPHCDYVCANLNPDLKIHIRRKHLPPDQAGLNSKAFTCPECSFAFNNKRDLRQHLKFHRNGPELKLYCEQCSFVTDCESRLRRHMCIHTKEKPFKCGLCDYRGSQKEHVLRHMKSQHNIDIIRKHKRSVDGQMSKDSLVTLERDFSSQAKIFACNHCSMKFSKLINLYKHLYTQHKNIMPSQKGDEFSCVVCDFHTSTKKNLLVHMRKHNVNDQNPPSHVYSCVLCSYMNPKRRNLFQHMKKKHHIEIVMKDDGSTSCFVTDNTNIREESDQHLLTVGDQVIATTSREILVNEESTSCPVIHMEDLAMVISNPHAGSETLMMESQGAITAPATITALDHHEAAEAIVGLTTLAGQGSVAEGVIEEQVQIMATDDQGTITVVEPVGVEGEECEVLDNVHSTQDAQEQLQILSSGDYVEIDGEVYKVEISNDDNGSDSTPVANVVLKSSPPHEEEAEDALDLNPMEPNLSIVKEEKED